MSRMFGFKTQEKVADCQLFFASICFGSTIVFQKYAMNNGIGPFAFNAYRAILSLLILYGTKTWTKSILHSNKSGTDTSIEFNSLDELERSSHYMRRLWSWGMLIGVNIAISATLQQVAIITISASKAGFICGSYVIMVPIVLWVMPYYNKKPCKWTWICVVFSVFGLYLLSGCSEGEVCIGGTISLAQIFMILGTFFMALVLITTDIATNKVDAVDLTAIYCLPMAILSVILGIIYEPQSFAYPFTSLRSNLVCITAIAVFNSVGSILGSLGQMYTQPGHAGLIFSLESVFCAIFSYLFLHERLSGMELIGCMIMFASVLLYSVMSSKHDENDTSSPINHEGQRNSPHHAQITYHEILGSELSQLTSEDDNRIANSISSRHNNRPSHHYSSRSSDHDSSQKSNSGKQQSKSIPNAKMELTNMEQQTLFSDQVVYGATSTHDDVL